MDLLSVFVFFLFTLPHWSISQVCNNRVYPSQYFASPSIFRGKAVLQNPPCPRSGQDFACRYNHILGDDQEVPAQPNLNGGDSNNDIGKFVVWQDGTQRPYIVFTFSSATTVTTINIEFLNYPAQNFSLPNLQLYTTGGLNVNPNSPSAQPIDFDIVNNSGLSQDDHQVTNISLIFSSTSQSFLLYWDYTDVYNLDFFMVSEVDFCNGTPPAVSTFPIAFQPPQVDNSVVVPTVDDFIASNNFLLTCTVSVSGLFEWQWRQNETLISNNAKFQIFTADGTRTSKLQLTGLSVTDAASYTCGVRRKSSSSGGTYVARIQTLSFPVNVELPEQVTGYVGEGQVVLTCEIHGFLLSTNPPTWQRGDDSFINSSSAKYSIKNGTTSQSSVLISNGTRVSGLRSTLTIRQLSGEDEGNYSCVADGASSSLELTVAAGTSPPPATTPGIGSNETSPSLSGSGNAGVIAAVVIIVLLVIIVFIILVVLLIVFLRSRDINWKIPSKKFNLPKPRRLSMEPLRRLSVSMRRSPKTDDVQTSKEESFMNGDENSPKKRLTKADIEWQLPHVDNIDRGEQAKDLAVYSVINKSEEEQPPPIPPQNFDPYEELSNGGRNVCAQNHYENDGFPGHKKSPERRLTNLSSPKLVKVKPETNKYGLDSNPIYEPSKVDLAANEEETSEQFEAPVYAEPKLLQQSSLSPDSTVDEPIYSEAIHPDLFSQGPESVQDSSLTPYAPIYADLHTLTKKKEAPPLKIPSYNIKELRPLGVGQFGEVMLAETVGLSRRDLKLSKTDNTRSIRLKVAVKKLRPQAQEQVRENFDKEIKFMSKLKDDNIVKLLAVSKDDPPFIVMEYMENGDLHQFLQDYEPATSDDVLEANQLPLSILLYMGVQIASGMRYLASLRYVHRDLATRNCLVGQNFVVKISDFGMSRSLYESSYYRVKGRAMLPIRWMASESFYGRFSEKTDVWSFGVTMWEIFTLAKHQPYEDIDDQEVIQDAIRGLSRRLLDKPEYCPMDVYEVMLRCWEYAPDERADFEEIFNTLAAIHQSL